MSSIVEFEDVGFFYLDAEAPESLSELGPEHINILFRGLSLSIPPGITSIIGENGVGKTTFMLLAAARLFPLSGKIALTGTPTETFRAYTEDPEVAARLGRTAGFVYQNMEFDDDRPLAELLETAAEFGGGGAAGSGGDAGADSSSSGGAGDFANVVRGLDLGDFLSRPATALPKGVLQRSVLALALLSSPEVLFLDEPVFALEEDRKEAALDFVGSWSRDRGRSVLFSAHQIHLCRDYADNTLLLLKHQNDDEKQWMFGPSKEICSKEVLEPAYRVPWETLHQKETLYREMLVKRYGSGE